MRFLPGLASFARRLLPRGQPSPLTRPPTGASSIVARWLGGLLLVCSSPLTAQLVEHGPWVGNLGARSADVHFILSENRLTTLEVSRYKTFSRYESYSQRTHRSDDPEGLAVFVLHHLEPDTTYYCRIRAGRVREYRNIGTFTTLPAKGTPTSFRFAFASSHTTGSEAGAFSEIRYQKPRLFFHLGNATDEVPPEADTTTWLGLYEKFFESFTQAELYRDVPLIYTWAERDYAGAATHTAFRTFFPHYPFPADRPESEASPELQPICRSFSLGRVRFIMLDTRTARSPVDAEHPTMLGAWQNHWLRTELKAAALDHALIFLVSPDPWHVRPSVSGSHDHWGYYADERTDIETWLQSENINNVAVLSGNAGFLAARISSGEPGDLHELQAGVIDQVREPAIGHWTDGPLLPQPAEEFFGLVEVQDNRTEIEVTFIGMNQHGRERFRSSFITRPAPLLAP